MRLPLVVLAIGSAILATTGAGAQQAPAEPAAEAGEEALALGRRMAEAGDFNAIIGAMGAAEIERIATEPAGLSDAERDALRATGTRVFAAQRAQLLEAVAPAYARTYAIEDLRAITGFLESPAGRAYTAGFPRLVPAIAAEMEGRDLARDVRAQFCAETGKLCEPAQ